MLRLRHLFLIFVLALGAMLGACSSDSHSGDGKKAVESMDNSSAGELGNSAGSIGDSSADRMEGENGPETQAGNPTQSTDRKVIRQAELHVRVKDFNEAQKTLESKAEQFGGFIVNSTISRDGDEQTSGTITIRVPASNFEAFLHEAEGEAAEILERIVRGEDVTEQYVDLASRLRSKKAVEARLLEFMKNATKTEDLLQISSDLGKVQEEIEQLTGKIKYLENQASMSTITVNLFENKLVAKGTTPSELNTWERTKKQFLSSSNFLLSFFSGLIVFIIGNLPVFVTLTAIVLISFLFIKKVVKRKGDEKLNS
ncbi:DUF4349 domain-containing protein [Bacillus sp. B-jedd]|uniref:DUF4349 domain-containing protein n=1 Tax=Bacillus sp. B-jedd TaxID=1476857 RepID=UPI000515630A|nr:DUF4349 domain-containing protein [Bacillus sp. B-jedd]CEG26652.1 hypothetical protein BN1002_01502 [Bacillus sp. B-jedd]